MIKTVGDLRKILGIYDENTPIKIEYYEEEKDFSWYTKVFSVYEIKNPENNHHEIIIEAN